MRRLQAFTLVAAATGTRAATLSPLIEAGGELIGGDWSGHLYAFRPTR